MTALNRKILLTGANGFIGKNLIVRLNEVPGYSVLKYVRSDNLASLPSLIAQADAVIHLAGENRPVEESAFEQVNTGLTATICDIIRQEVFTKCRHVPLVMASSTQAESNNPYGRSKRAAEAKIQALAQDTNNPCVIFRLPGVFGKWCKPNYNSVVATFCYNIARNLPIQLNERADSIRLVYVDDVVTSLLVAAEAPTSGCVWRSVEPEYSISVSELAAQIRAFGQCRSSLMTERVGKGFLRALYATYMSYLPHGKFSYDLPKHVDSRGVFVEVIKTPDSGQFSYFTAHPGITRGGHYHHTKTEKFLVIKGEALFRFRHLLTDELVEIRTSGVNPQIVDTIPGWSHDISNVGNDELIVMLWASENFDRQSPDTVTHRI